MLSNLPRLFLLLLMLLIASAHAWNPTVAQTKKAAVVATVVVVTGCGAMVVDVGTAVARNSPESTRASGTSRGEAAALKPIVEIDEALAVPLAALALPDLSACSTGLGTKAMLTKEKDFKRIFDEYSADVGYKQKYLDSNAFGVYYTKGFDGPGRDSIDKEDPDTLLQEAQYGFRNDAWVGVDEARAELSYQLTQPQPVATADLRELKMDLLGASAATTAYLKLAPTDQLRHLGWVAPE